MFRSILLLATVAAIAGETGVAAAALAAPEPVKQPAKAAAPTGKQRGGRVAPAPVRVMPLPPTSPASAFGPGFPRPPVPSGHLPIATYRWPFEVLPYYDALPSRSNSPYARYLRSPRSAQETFELPRYELLYVPAYVAPSYHVLPGRQPLY